MKLGLIFPHQLFENHPVLKYCDKSLLVHEQLILGGDKHWPIVPHAKKLLLHHVTMSLYSSKHSLDHIDSLYSLEVTNVDQIVVCRLVDDLLERRLVSFCGKNDIEFVELSTPGFVTPKEWGKQFFEDKKKPFMKVFYEAQRKRMNVLMDTEMNPIGGRWSYDDENRKKFPKKEIPPKDPTVYQTKSEQEQIKQCISSLDKSGIKVFGDYGQFIYPVSHQSARMWLDEFLKERYKHFGTFEDALTYRSKFLYHSILTPVLNIGLLTPQQVLDRALELGDKYEIDINNQEGFIRQIIGWREYMAIMYEMHGRNQRRQNFWKFTDSMPKSIYNNKTGIPILDDVLNKVKKDGYAHHIERLMVLGNFFLLIRVHPDHVYHWFSEMFIDAFDWVMVPNVYGMSQFCDGGLFVTKPYISGSNYLKKMSDYQAGEWCDVWDALFWSFIDDYREFFSNQYRMKMMVSHLNKMSNNKLKEHHKIAQAYREKLQLGGYLGDDIAFLC